MAFNLKNRHLLSLVHHSEREIRYLPVPDRYVADNEDWRYELSQEDLALTGVSRLTVEHCRPDDYAGLITRLLHESRRDGARCILLRDSEDSARLVIGQRYGFYEIRENTNPESRNSFPYLATEAESARHKRKESQIAPATEQ